MPSLRVLFAVTPLLCLMPLQGLAASENAKERAARRACLTGNPEKGVAILTDLFIDTGDLNY